MLHVVPLALFSFCFACFHRSSMLWSIACLLVVRFSKKKTGLCFCAQCSLCLARCCHSLCYPGSTINVASDFPDFNQMPYCSWSHYRGLEWKFFSKWLLLLFTAGCCLLSRWSPILRASYLIMPLINKLLINCWSEVVHKNSALQVQTEQFNSRCRNNLTTHELLPSACWHCQYNLAALRGFVVWQPL